MHTVELTPRAQRELDRLPRDTLQGIVQALGRLEENPRLPGAVKLYGSTHRLRVGQWRIIYQIRDREQMVVIGKIARRSESTYRSIRDLF